MRDPCRFVTAQFDCVQTPYGRTGCLGLTAVAPHHPLNPPTHPLLRDDDWWGRPATQCWSPVLGDQAGGDPNWIGFNLGPDLIAQIQLRGCPQFWACFGLIEAVGMVQMGFRGPVESPSTSEIFTIDLDRLGPARFDCWHNPLNQAFM